MNKVLTVAVPSYNVEKYLADSLASYCADGVDERLEVLVIDDGSTDMTPLIANEFVKLHPELFRVVSKPNGGHGSAINAGIANASGTYFRIIDGDDRIYTKNIPALLDALEQASEDLVIDVKREVTIGTGASRLLDPPDDLPLDHPVPFDSVCNRFDIEEFFMIHSVNARTDFLREHDIRLLEHTFYVDYEFIVKIASFAKDVRFLNLEVCNYFVGNAEQSVAPANYVRRWGDHTRVTEELLRFADDARAEGSLASERQTFVDSRVSLIVNTHYNIALIYDDDRERGMQRAREFRAYLAQHHPGFHARSELRFRQAQLLHRLGFNAQRLDKLMRR